MYFDNLKFFEYIRLCRERGIDIPIVPGIKPLTKRYQLASIPRKFFVNMPDELVREVNKAQTDEAVCRLVQNGPSTVQGIGQGRCSLHFTSTLWGTSRRLRRLLKAFCRIIFFLLKVASGHTPDF
jgi:hypothetical protein